MFGRSVSPRTPIRVLTCLGLALCATVGVVPALTAQAADPGLPVVPRVDSYAAGTGTFTLGGGSRFVVDTSTSGTATTGATAPLLVGTTLDATVTSLASQFRAQSGLALPVVTGTTPDSDDVYVKLAAASGQGTEGYRIVTSGSAGTTITAATSAGAFYGGQTLLQRLKAGGWSTSAGTLDDAPDAGQRSVSVDVARNFWTVNELKDLIRRMGQFKLNALQIHFNENDAFRLYSTNAAYSALAPSNAAFRYSRADIDSIVAFGKAYQVTIIPEIDTPYHAGALTRDVPSRGLSPECGASFADTLDILDPAVRTWSVGLYQEFLSWFPGPYVHIGNDEVPLTLNNCSYVSGSGKSIEQWQIDYVNQLNTAVKAAGKTTMMWANGPDILPSTDVVFVNFGSASNAAFLRGQGYRVVDTAWNAGSYQRFFVIPGAMRDPRTPRESEIYGWTWPGGTNNLGQHLAIWMDYANTSDNYSTVDVYRNRLATFAERIWNTSAPTLSATQFATRLAGVGDAPGVAARPTATTNTTTPALKYTFDARSALSTAEFTSPAQAYASSGSVNLPAVIGAGGSLSTVAGRTGNAVRFSGGSYQALNVGDGRLPTSWTIGTWVRPTANTADSSLVSSWLGAVKLAQNQTGKVGVTVFGVADSSFEYTAPLNTWTHLTFVSTGSQVKLYVNGVPHSTLSVSMPYPGGTIGGQKAITGDLDDLTVFYGALSDSQVATLAN